MKKYFEKFKNLKSTNKKLYYATICMFVLIGFTFAYVIDQISGGAISRVFITADTADNLQFLVDKDISIKPTQFNFTQGGVDLSDTATATARLKANSTDKTANYRYNVYFLIEKNEYIYTTEDHKPEMLLQVTTPNGEALTEINGLNYNNDLNGFDITELEKLIVISNKYEISSNSNTSFTEQNWVITVKFINLETNQIDNEGKTLNGKIIIQKEELGEFNINIDGDVPLTVGKFANITCIDANATWNQKYNQLEVTGVSSAYNFCNMNYNERTEKQYLNQYVSNLVGTSQGDGNVIHTIAKKPVFNNSVEISYNEYKDIDMFLSSNDWSGRSENSEEVFEFDETTMKWKNIPEKMENRKYYDIKFIPENSGYYEICYKINKSDNTYNRLYFFLNNQTTTASIYIDGLKFAKSSTTSDVSGCVNLGYLENNSHGEVEVKNYTYSTIADVEFQLKRTDTLEDVDAGIRYTGKNPNNYVWFNNELWRMIGVFGEESHGQKGQQLVKLIKDTDIGELIWGYNKSQTSGYDDGMSNWEEASLNKLLNEAYLNQGNANDTDDCYISYRSGRGKGFCDYRNIGIDLSYRKMIKEVTWYLGGWLSNSGSANDIYIHERDNIVQANNPFKTTNYIGLIYVSDYLYIEENNTVNNNWMNNPGKSMWTITPASTAYQGGYAFYVSGKFYISDYSTTSNSRYTTEGEFVRPTLYLNSNVYLIDGNGTTNDPYIIGM